MLFSKLQNATNPLNYELDKTLHTRTQLECCIFASKNWVKFKHNYLYSNIIHCTWMKVKQLIRLSTSKLATDSPVCVETNITIVYAYFTTLLPTYRHVVYSNGLLHRESILVTYGAP